MRRSKIEEIIDQKLEEQAEEERKRREDREAWEYLESRGVSFMDISDEFGQPDFSYSYERGELANSLYEWKRIQKLLEKIDLSLDRE